MIGEREVKASGEFADRSHIDTRILPLNLSLALRTDVAVTSPTRPEWNPKYA